MKTNHQYSILSASKNKATQVTSSTSNIIHAIKFILTLTYQKMVASSSTHHLLLSNFRRWIKKMFPSRFLVQDSNHQPFT